jgi:hypothetical protein
MTTSSRARPATPQPPTPGLPTTIAIWLFVVVEAIGIGYVLFTY